MQLVVSLAVVPNVHYFFFRQRAESPHNYYHQQSAFVQIVDQSLKMILEIQFLSNKDTKKIFKNKCRSGGKSAVRQTC